MSGDCYVGSSKNLIQRKNRHFKDLRERKHHSIILQRAWDKYGPESFSFEIIEECSVDQLLNIEQKYIDLLNPVYNIAKVAGSPLGVKQSLEACEAKRRWAIENNFKPVKQSYEWRMRIVLQCDPNTGEVIAEHESISAACRAVGKNHKFVTVITQVCNETPIYHKGRTKPVIRRTAFGYKWRFK